MKKAAGNVTAADIPNAEPIKREEFSSFFIGFYRKELQNICHSAKL
jgi:hypothetical protein